MKNLDRRSFLKKSGIALSSIVVTLNFDGKSWAFTEHNKKKITNLTNLKPRTPVYFNYPDDSSPCILIKTQEVSLGGIGSDKDIIAYSLLCTHKGCLVNYKNEDNSFVCPCHHTKFDCSKAGEIVIGQATENLPQIHLTINKKSEIVASGVRELIFGRFSNNLK